MQGHLLDKIHLLLDSAKITCAIFFIVASFSSVREEVKLSFLDEPLSLWCSVIPDTNLSLLWPVWRIEGDFYFYVESSFWHY